MLQMLDFGNYSREALMLMAVASMIAIFLIGYITDAVLAERGFGPFGNGGLAVVGALVGIYTRQTYFGHSSGDEILITGGLAACAATAMLLALGIVKHWVSD